MDGSDYARAVPPPGKLKPRTPAPDPDAAEEDQEEPGDRGHLISMIEELGTALGVKVRDPEAACEALENYLDAAGYKRD